MARLRAELTAQLEEAKQAGRLAMEEAVGRIHAEHEARISEIFAQHREELAAQSEKLRAALSDAIKQEREKHRAELESERQIAIAKAEAELLRVSQSHEEAMNAAGLRFADEKDKLEGEIAKLRSSHGGALAAVEEQLRTAKQHLLAKQTALTEANEALEKERSTTAGLTQQVRDMRAAHAQDLEAERADKEKQLQATAAQHRKELDDLLARQIEETNEMAAQFAESQRLLEQQIAVLEDQYAELQALYENRPSRDEDLERIAALTQEVQEKTAQLTQLAAQLQTYKLELVNREQNYNKVFGANPNVGVMDPLAHKRPNSTKNLTAQNSRSGLPHLPNQRAR